LPKTIDSPLGLRSGDIYPEWRDFIASELLLRPSPPDTEGHVVNMPGLLPDYEASVGSMHKMLLRTQRALGRRSAKDRGSNPE
jgi:hypothetical protein